MEIIRNKSIVANEKIVVVNFANEPFRKQQKDNTASALQYGKVDEVFEYSEKDLDSKYYTDNPNITKYKRGFGLWLWKPYIILKAMESLNENDILIYSDSGITFIKDVHIWLPFLNNSKDGILLFELPLLNMDWTKREAFIYARHHPKESDRQLLGGLMVIRINNKSKDFIKQWYQACQDERILSPKIFDKTIKEHQFFKEHREDQSVLTIVAAKNKITALPDPSEWGEWTFLTEMNNRCNLWDYKRPYPTIVLINRKADSTLYLRKYKKKHLLHSIGLYNATSLKIKRNVLKFLRGI